MQFYRRWQPVAAITFDLDDTLYDNGPAIARAEQWMLGHLRSEYLATAMLDKPRWLALKRQLLLSRPELRDDVSLARLHGIREALVQGGMPPSQAAQEAETVFAGFLAERSKIAVSDETHALLARLAGRYPLAVITNGNLDLVQAGLADYFTLVCKAGAGARMKPAPDMFMQVQAALGLAPGRILHVGDHPETDVLGARLHGFRAAWLNERGQSWQSLSLLPDVELGALHELAGLLL
ncbi:HAD family hydrolase [Aeromonas taiwanensis]|uniref:HAD family hydrolase n=1 Tax=Aeromonas taiwanensis TaxID=633417 RepID=A0A5F0KD58_9GAMM|nr:HAD-IA family hydrolase [Aeromonas taiwanensis]TFF77842.1 HAD family hydrolase [Aeromonas taiwanensis]TFF78295.1 HAD family hydrolase [Aeromonas taiwanensis]TFF82108.1 HAD family hydrolase [Aeromonas taiwanensis]